MLRGRQKPRLEWVPDAPTSAGDDCIEFAAEFGLRLDPWQQHVVRTGLGEQANGQWQCFECGLIVPRQNGKGAILEALELFWLFLCDEDRLILHSAHEFKTAREAFLRIRGLIESGPPEYRAMVKQFYASTGGECGIELLDGTRLRFVARSTGAGRGFSGDKLVLDEAYNLPDSAIDAVLPTVGARLNPQIWYTSSPGDFTIAPCEVLGRIRRRGLARNDPRLAFWEWSAPHEDGLLTGSPTDRRLWAMAQPGLGIRKTEERIANFQASMSPAGFAREELGVGNYPKDVGLDSVFGPHWTKCSTTNPPGPIKALGFAVSIDHDWATLGCVDGAEIPHIGVVYRDRTPEVVAAKAVELSKSLSVPLAVDSIGPAAYLIPYFEEQGVWLEQAKTADYTGACAEVYDAVTAPEPGLCHGDYPELNDAAAATVTRPIGDRWAWARKEGEISAMEAATLAWWARQFGYSILDSVL